MSRPPREKFVRPLTNIPFLDVVKESTLLTIPTKNVIELCVYNSRAVSVFTRRLVEEALKTPKGTGTLNDIFAGISTVSSNSSEIIIARIINGCARVNALMSLAKLTLNALLENDDLKPVLNDVWQRAEELRKAEMAQEEKGAGNGSKGAPQEPFRFIAHT